jgi:hypothetical protein
MPTPFPFLVQLSGTPDRSRFQVVRAGRIGDTAFAAGDVIVCGAEPLDGQLTVLVARGAGRPRFGRVRGIRLLGEVGEPCDPGRWRAAGRILAHHQHSDAFDQLELFVAA